MSGLIVHEWLERTGGAERVVEAMAEAFPSADLLVLWNDAPDRLADRRISESWLSRSPLRRHKAAALPFMIPTWRGVKPVNTPDWMLVSSHLFAHHVRISSAPDIPKFVYAHTPARYVWHPEMDARGQSFPVRLASKMLRPVDRSRAAEAAKVAANSHFVRARIEQSWGRDADVIYPPVDVERIRSGGPWKDRLGADEDDILSALPSEFVLGASRFIPYKRLDRVIEAGEAMGLPVVIAGRGPLEADLRSQAAAAAVPVVIIGSPSDSLLFALYEMARAFIFPAVEDFGIMPVEAMACGTPVITVAEGGVRETVGLVGGGAIVDEFSPEEWRGALSVADRVDRSALPEKVAQFSTARFVNEMINWVERS